LSNGLVYNNVLRNRQAEQIAIVLGDSAVSEIRSGGPPPSCVSDDSGTLLASLSLPRRPFAAARDGILRGVGLWGGIAVASGVAGHFRFKSSNGVC
jgi:hypothetical protein